MNKALSNADTQKALGGDAEIMKYAELGNLCDIDNLLPVGKDSCNIFYENTQETALDSRM